MARDWPADLWPTSFKGLPFWVRKVESEFGKRLQEDEFPEQDLPFIQDLGASIRTEQVDAYLVGDSSDIDADSFVDLLEQVGPGMLVLPDQGPVLARFKKGRRSYELDRMGFIGFSLSFVREGTATANVSTDFLAQLVFDASDALGGALSALTRAVTLS